MCLVKTLVSSVKKSEQTWIIISCQSKRTDEDTLSWILFEQGALGLEILDVDKETITIKASFHPKDASKETIDELNYQLKHANLVQAAETLKIENIANEDWLRNWKKHFEPFAIGETFLICPPWHFKNLPAKQINNRTIIIIDPGMAFGTGLHATTSYCLQAIERGFEGSTILDVGTGSGILSIACALRMPATKILAIDNDENATTNAEHNIELNHVQKQIKVSLESPVDLLPSKANHHKFETILSNLTAEVIIDLLPSYNKLLKAGGTLILAGIIEERLTLIEKALAKFSFKTIHKNLDRGWIGLTLTKV